MMQKGCFKKLFDKIEKLCYNKYVIKTKARTANIFYISTVNRKL